MIKILSFFLVHVAIMFIGEVENYIQIAWSIRDFTFFSQQGVTWNFHTYYEHRGTQIFSQHSIQTPLQWRKTNCSTWPQLLHLFHNNAYSWITISYNDSFSQSHPTKFLELHAYTRNKSPLKTTRSTKETSIHTEMKT